MNDTLTKILFDKYPVLYRNRLLPETKSRMCDEFQCDNGWFDLLNQLSADLSSVGHKTGVWPIVFQVKEKFGMLCFYYDLSPDKGDLPTGVLGFLKRWIWKRAAARIYERVAQAESESTYTCETCGEKGASLDTRYYYKLTLCRSCMQDRRDRYVQAGREAQRKDLDRMEKEEAENADSVRRHCDA